MHVKTTPLVSSVPSPRGFPNALAPTLSCIKVHYILDYLLPHLVLREGVRSLRLLVYCKAGPVTYSTVPSGSHNSTDRLGQFYKPEMPGGNKEEHSLAQWERKPTFQAILKTISVHKEGGTGRGGCVNYRGLPFTTTFDEIGPLKLISPSLRTTLTTSSLTTRKWTPFQRIYFPHVNNPSTEAVA